jgi:hypothetical protein
MLFLPFGWRLSNLILSLGISLSNYGVGWQTIRFELVYFMWLETLGEFIFPNHLRREFYVDGVFFAQEIKDEIKKLERTDNETNDDEIDYFY